MQPGSVGQSINPSLTSGVRPARIGQPHQAPLQEVVADVELPKEEVTLAARFKTTTEALQTEDAGDGQLRSKMTIALAPQASQAELEKLGVIFPEIEEVRSNIGLKPDGRLELVPVDGTDNEQTVHILQTLEVPKADLVKDSNGQAPIDAMSAILVPEGGSAIPKGWMGVPEGSLVAPKGYEFRMGTSAEGAKTEKKRLRLNTISDGLGGFAQSSLAGVITLPYVSAAAPLIALAAAGPSLNKHYEALKESQDVLGYVQQREKLSSTDKITLELGVDAAIPVSAQAEKKRLELKVRTAKAKLASTSLLGLAGGSSVVGFMAGGGAFGTGAVAGALTGAMAATPYLAGAAMIIGSGGMVVNSLSELKSLSQEKAELLSLQEKGETHVLKTIERVSPELARPVAVGEEQVPIQEWLQGITKEQRKHRLLATALSGGIGSIALTVGMGASALTLAPLAIAPAGALAAGQSIARLKELSQEKKELVELHKSGATMVGRQVERQDGSWGEEKIPITTLLKDIEKKQKTNSLILTAAGSAAGMIGLTLGAGLSVAAAAPLLLIPAAVGALMFPDKVKAFAEKVSGFVTGKLGAAGRSRKELLKQAEQANQQAKDDLKTSLEPLVKKHPGLFYVPSEKEQKEAQKSKTDPPMGFFTVLDVMMDKYASAGSRMARYEAMQAIEALLARAPEEAGEAVPGVRERLRELHMGTEAGWVARDVMLEMKKGTTDKVVSDSRVKERFGELGLPTDDLKSRYEESLYLEHDDKKLGEVMRQSQGGDRDATLQLASKELFSASRMYYQSQEELGPELLAKLADALQRPSDEANLETVIKEVNYKLGRPMTPATGQEQGSAWWLEESTLTSQSGLNEPLRLADFSTLAQALQTLDKPIDLNAVGSAPSPATLQGPQARMASAFRELHGVDAEAATRLGQAFATLNDPEAFEGLTPAAAQQKRVETGLELTRAKAELEAKAPEIVKLWDGARVDVEEAFFQNSLDEDFAAEVLARPEVLETAERLGLGAEDAKSLYMGLLRSHITGDSQALRGQLIPDGAKEVDPAKSELLEAIDRSISTVTAQSTQGGNDTTVNAVELGNPTADPSVDAFLSDNPVVGEVLASSELDALAGELGLSPEQVRQSYLTLVQAQLSPALTAEFEGRLQGGDLQTVQTFQVASRVGQLVQAATRPSPELVAEQLETIMAGPVAVSVLTHPEIVALGEKLQVDNSGLLRTLLAADLAGDASDLQSIQARAQKGEPAAQAELQMIQTLAVAVQQVGAELAAGPPTGEGPPLAA